MTRAAIEPPEEVAALFRRAERSFAAGDAEDALMAIGLAAVADVHSYGGALTGTAGGALAVGRGYADLFERMGLACEDIESRGRVEPSGPLRVVYVLFQLSVGQGASARLAQVCERHDRSRVRPHVVVSEDGVEEATFDRARVLRRRFESSGVPIESNGCGGGWLERGDRLTRRLCELGGDVCVFIGGLACVTQVQAAYRRVARVQMNQNMACPLLVPGIDGVLYHHRWSAERDRAALASAGVSCVVTNGAGVDVASADRLTPAARGSFGARDGEVVLVTVSNRLESRVLAGGFVDRLAGLLHETEGVRWVGVGGGGTDGLKRRLAELGVAGRATLVGGLEDPRPIVKACDVYLNEYPEGGCNSVLEAMSCGVAVVALEGGGGHTTRIGAECVGAAHATLGGDVDAYWRRVRALIDDATERKSLGEEMRRRAAEAFDYSIIARQWEDAFERAVEARGGRSEAAGVSSTG